MAENCDCITAPICSSNYKVATCLEDTSTCKQCSFPAPVIPPRDELVRVIVETCDPCLSE